MWVYSGWQWDPEDRDLRTIRTGHKIKSVNFCIKYLSSFELKCQSISEFISTTILLSLCVDQNKVRTKYKMAMCV